MMIQIEMGPGFDGVVADLGGMGQRVLDAASEGLAVGVQDTAAHIQANLLTGQALKTRTGLLKKAVDGWMESKFDAVVGVREGSGVDQYNAVFSPLMFKTIKTPTPYCYRCPVGKKEKTCSLQCIDKLEKILKTKAGKIAAMIFEPLMAGAGGIIVYPKQYLKKAAALAKKYNVHLILDEVATGFGRTGKMFACQHAAVQPDFMCISKGITNGTMALAATLTTDKIYNAFYADYEKHKTFFHGHTYTANPIACAAAVASLKLFKEEDTLARAQQLIPILRKGMEKFRHLPIVGDVRTIGLVAAVELVEDKSTKKIPARCRQMGMEIFKKGLKRNLLLRPLGNISYLFLPLCVTKRQLKYILENFYDILKTVKC